MIELDEKENAIRPPAAPADVGRSLENHQPLVYRAQALQLGSAHSFSVQKRQSSSSVTTTESRSKNVTETSCVEEEVKVAAENVGKIENIIEVTPTAYGVLQPKAEFAFQVRQVATREYCSARDTIFE